VVAALIEAATTCPPLQIDNRETIMRASGPLKMRIHLKAAERAGIDRTIQAIRAHAGEAGLDDVTVSEDAEGTIVDVAGEEEALRRFWTIAHGLEGTGLIVLRGDDAAQSA
jgi:hypothetical protein